MSGAPSVPPAERRRSRPRRRLTPAAVLAWVVVAGLASLARLDEGLRGTARAADGETADAGGGEPVRHEPVTVVGDWQHQPVHVVASRPAPTTPRSLPKPFAAMRLAANPLIMPRLALPRVLSPRFPALRSLLTRARPGEPVHVRLSAYCLQGRTRRGTRVRPGIIAADPRVFPFARHVELYAAGRYLGRFRVEDTGKDIRGTRIDIWTPDCSDAVRFGMRDGVAQLVARGEE